MTGITLITVSNNVLLIVILFLILFSSNDLHSHYRRSAWAGGLVGMIALAILVLFVAGVLAQEGTVAVTVVPSPSFADQIIPVAVALAAAIGIIMAAVLPAIAGVRKLISEVRAEQTTQAVTVKQLETNTNSISEKLRAAIEEGALAKGNLVGRAELQAENDALDLATRNSRSGTNVPAGTTGDPMKVEVANPKPVKVTETKT